MLSPEITKKGCIIITLYIPLLCITFPALVFAKHIFDPSAITKVRVFSSRHLSSSSVSLLNEDTRIAIGKEVKDCCVCFAAFPFTTINETQFRKLFGFHCLHASVDICSACWMQISAQNPKQRRCPICRTTSADDNLNSPDFVINNGADISYARFRQEETGNINGFVAYYHTQWKEDIASICCMIIILIILYCICFKWH